MAIAASHTETLRDKYEGSLIEPFYFLLLLSENCMASFARVGCDAREWKVDVMFDTRKLPREYPRGYKPLGGIQLKLHVLLENISKSFPREAEISEAR